MSGLTSNEAAAAMLAMSALMATHKRTVGAAQRCAKRTDRAINALINPPATPFRTLKPDGAAAAVDLIHRRCAVCQLCKGRGI